MKNAHSQNSEVSALDKRDFKPEYPSHGTQAARLLAAVLAGRKINPLAGWRMLGIYRLSDTKFRLKEVGWPMESDRLDVTNRFAESCRVAIYGLPDWAIEAAGVQGQQFAAREFELMNHKEAA